MCTDLAMRRGLYVHIPFCLKKCHYCDFVITTQRAPTDKRHFLEALRNEAHHAVQKYGRLKFDTLYLGGGTPSALEPDEFDAVLEILRTHFDFQFDFEFTIEINPGDVSSEKLAAYQRAGVNRASLGIQAFQENLLKDMNRPHGVHEVEKTIFQLREVGISNLSLDMILNLPNQTLVDVEATLKKLLQLQPNQISVYDLDVHEKTVYGRRRREGRLHLASEEIHACMTEKTVKMLAGEGFVQYELSNFAKPGFESKHNMIYWNNESYLGLGPGAFSYMDDVRYQFADSVENYLKKIKASDWTHGVEDKLSNEEIEKETLLTGIRLREGFDLNRLQLIREAFEKEVESFMQEKLIERQGSRVKFTAKGKLVADLILAIFAKIKTSEKNGYE